MVVRTQEVGVGRSDKRDGQLIRDADEIGLEPEFASLVVDLAQAVAAGVKPDTLSEVTVQGCTVNGEPCKDGCCAPVRRPQR